MEIIFVLIYFLALIMLANYAAARANPELDRALHWLFRLTNVPIFVFGLLLLFVTPEMMAEMEVNGLLQDLRPVGIVFLVIAILGALVTLPEVRGWLARFIPVDPRSPVHTLALMFSSYLAGYSALALVQGGLEALAETAEATSIILIVAQGVLFALVGLLGVGFLSRRDWKKVAARLGLEVPTMSQLWRGLGWVAVLLVLQIVTAYLWLLLQPDEAELLTDVNMAVLEEIDTVWEWFLLALAAAVGEEILFRGAVQPVLGLWVTSFLFALAHVNYSLTPVTAFVFFIGLVLGLIRRRSSTTVAIYVHFAYNFVIGLSALYGPQLEEMAAMIF